MAYRGLWWAIFRVYGSIWLKFLSESPFGLIIWYMNFELDIMNFGDGFDTLWVPWVPVGVSNRLFSVFMA